MFRLFPSPPAVRGDGVARETGEGLCATHTQDPGLKTMSTPPPRSPLPPSEPGWGSNPASTKQKTTGAWPGPMHSNHLEILVKYKFWFTKSVAGPETMFLPSSRWWRYCWSADQRGSRQTPTKEVLISDDSEMAVKWGAVEDTPKKTRPGIASWPFSPDPWQSLTLTYD